MALLSILCIIYMGIEMYRIHFNSIQLYTYYVCFQVLYQKCVLFSFITFITILPPNTPLSSATNACRPHLPRYPMLPKRDIIFGLSVSDLSPSIKPPGPYQTDQTNILLFEFSVVSMTRSADVNIMFGRYTFEIVRPISQV